MDVNVDEKSVINKVLGGDTSAFSHLVDAYQDMAITIAYRICWNRQDAEDIVQNAFVKAYHNLHTFRADSKFSTWFYRIVYNTSLTHIKTSIFNTNYEDYKLIDTDMAHVDLNYLEHIHDKDRKNIINSIMEKMPKDEALILTLYYLEENSVKDICIVTCLSESNVKVKLHRARKRFAEILEQTVKIKDDLAHLKFTN